MKNNFIFIVILIFCCFPFFLNAQKLPSIQKTNVSAPRNIKIDGKADEWNNKFQAYNGVNRVFYTVSNDENNLYLIIATGDQYSFAKIIYGGITFTLSSPIDKSSKRIAISYPMIVKQYKGIVVDNDREIRKYVKKNDTTKEIAKNHLDSVTFAITNKINSFFKEIEIKGVSELQDSLISIYNSGDIKANIQYNKKLQLIYELAFPLKYLKSIGPDVTKFKYDIRLNGLPQEGQPIFDDPYNTLGPDNLFVNQATNFGGEYILSKK